MLKPTEGPTEEWKQLAKDWPTYNGASPRPDDPDNQGFAHVPYRKSSLLAGVRGIFCKKCRRMIIDGRYLERSTVQSQDLQTATLAHLVQHHQLHEAYDELRKYCDDQPPF